MSKFAFKGVSLLVSILGGAAAGAIFKQTWKLALREEDAPEPTDRGRGWGEILLAAALRGAILGVVTAALDRGAAVSAARLTGSWPGEDKAAGRR